MSAPRVAYWLLCYQHERYVREAVASALAQEGPPLDILVSDDCSTDRTYEIARELLAAYRGPHRVRLNRNDRNLGVEHYDRLTYLTDAELIVIAHGDDVALPHRAARLARALAEPRVFMASSNAMVVDGDGAEQGLFSGIAAASSLEAADIIGKVWRSDRLGATLAMRREVMSAFASLGRRGFPAGIDIMLPFRAGILGRLLYLPEPLLRYRRHGANATYLLGDKDNNEVEFKEGMARYLLRAMHKNLEDLSAYMKARPDDARLVELQALLMGKILYHSARQTRLQNELMLSGRRLQWTAKD